MLFQFQSVSFDNYHHLSREGPLMEKMLNVIDDEEKLDLLVKVYTGHTQFTRYDAMKKVWYDMLDERYSDLQTSNVVEMLIYMLNMYLCKRALIKRKSRKYV